MNLKNLSRPFPPDAVSWRVGPTNGDKTSGIALAYIDARDVMDRLDNVCGPADWQSKHDWSDGKRVCCSIAVKIGEEWIWKSDGAGETDVEADKGAFSDSLKRAAVQWGIGRYLYSLTSPWVPIVPAGRSYRIADEGLASLTEVLRGVTVEWYAREYADSVAAIKDGIASKMLNIAAEAWYELDNEVKAGLWVAPSKGGIFTTEERNVIKSTEFREAHFGGRK